MEAATVSSDTSENFPPDYMAYAYNLNFNLCALTPLKMGGHTSHNADSEATLHAVARHSHNHTRG